MHGRGTSKQAVFVFVLSASISHTLLTAVPVRPACPEAIVSCAGVQIEALHLDGVVFAIAIRGKPIQELIRFWRE
jgi:hypothetical protein